MMPIMVRTAIVAISLTSLVPSGCVGSEPQEGLEKEAFLPVDPDNDDRVSLHDLVVGPDADFESLAQRELSHSNPRANPGRSRYVCQSKLAQQLERRPVPQRSQSQPQP